MGESGTLRRVCRATTVTGDRASLSLRHSRSRAWGHPRWAAPSRLRHWRAEEAASMKQSRRCPMRPRHPRRRAPRWGCRGASASPSWAPPLWPGERLGERSPSRAQRRCGGAAGRLVDVRTAATEMRAAAWRARHTADYVPRVARATRCARCLRITQRHLALRVPSGEGGGGRGERRLRALRLWRQAEGASLRQRDSSQARHRAPVGNGPPPPARA